MHRNYDKSSNDTNMKITKMLQVQNTKWNLFSFGETQYKYESKQKEYLARGQILSMKKIKQMLIYN